APIRSTSSLRRRGQRAVSSLTQHWSCYTANRRQRLTRSEVSVLKTKRLIAALLPFSFLWVFMACVSICERETLASAPKDLPTSDGITKIRHERERDGCPLSYFPKAAVPQREKF